MPDPKTDPRAASPAGESRPPEVEGAADGDEQLADREQGATQERPDETSAEPSRSEEQRRAPDSGPVAEPEAPLTGRDRLVDALTHPRRGQVLAAVLLALVAFAGVTQVRTNVDDSTYAGSREQDLIDILSGLAGTTQRAQSQLQDLERTKERLDSDTSKREAALQEAQNKVSTLSVLAGLVPVRGPGIKVTIEEKTGAVKSENLLDLIEELRTNGAEAIAINDQVRVVAQSSIEQGVGGLVVDGKLLTSPYVVSVIGDPAVLKSAVTFGRGPADELEGDGADVQVAQVQDLQIHAVRKAGDGTS